MVINKFDNESIKTDIPKISDYYYSLIKHCPSIIIQKRLQKETKKLKMQLKLKTVSTKPAIFSLSCK